MPSPDFPEDSFQTIVVSGSWWTADTSKELVRGKLVWAHVQFFDEIPLQLLPRRADDQQHSSAILQAAPLRADQNRSDCETLPVAALPRRDGADGFVVNRAKRRPCLILGGVEPTRVSDQDGKGQPNWSIAPYSLAVPYYSVDQAFPLSHQPQSYVATGFRLSSLALEAIDEWLNWYITGLLPIAEESDLRDFRDLMQDFDAEASSVCGS